jgi:hypothetical protein
MMVRDDGPEVHLLSVMSPDWMGAKKTISVERGPTEFGDVSFTLTQPDDNTARIEMDLHWRQKPEGVILHLPWFATIQHIAADGKTLPVNGETVRIPIDTRVVTIHWHRRTDAPDWSYDEAVQQFRKEYQQHYELYMHGR